MAWRVRIASPNHSRVTATPRPELIEPSGALSAAEVGAMCAEVARAAAAGLKVRRNRARHTSQE